MKGNLYLMMGVAGSGKSTWLKNHLPKNGAVYVSRDEIRFDIVSEEEGYFSKEKEVFDLFAENIKLLLSMGLDVYADATHLSYGSRRKLLKAVGVNSYKKAFVIWIKASLEDCLFHNELRINTRSYVPPKTIESMYTRIKEPELEEGFDTIFIVESNKPIQIKRRILFS